MARPEVMRMRIKAPANLHKVEPVMMPEVNAAVIFIGTAAIILMAGLLFNFMMDDFNLLLMRCI